MAGMGNHGRHRHRASTGFTPEATASGDPSTGSADDWFEAGFPPDRPKWQVDDVGRASGWDGADRADQSAGRWYPEQSAVDSPGPADRTGERGWDHTLDGRGALGGSGAGSAGATGDFPFPRPRDGAESTGRHAVWSPEPEWPGTAAAGADEPGWPQAAADESRWPEPRWSGNAADVPGWPPAARDEPQWPGAVADGREWPSAAPVQPRWPGAAQDESDWPATAAAEPEWPQAGPDEPQWPQAGPGQPQWPGPAREEPAWPQAAPGEPEWPDHPAWASAPEWFAPEQEEPAQPAASAWAPRNYRVATPEPARSEPYDQPTHTEPGDPWHGAAETTNSGHWPDQPDASDWPTETHSALSVAPRRGDAAVGEYEEFDAPERPPLPGRHEVRSSVRHPLKLAIYGVVLAGLIGGTAAWATMDKSVTITVDGEGRSVHTHAGKVGGVLNDNKIAVGKHDILAPAADAPVKDGTEIVLRRGRLLRLNVDGASREVWVTAVSVDEALTQVGFGQGGLYLSASRSKRLPLDGFSLTIRTPKDVTVIADGHTKKMVSTAATVGDLLDTAKVKIGTTDRVSQLANAIVTDGMTITIVRVKYGKQLVQTVVKYKVIEKKDATKDKGTKTVETTGVDGLQEVTYLVTYLNGKAASKKVVSTRVLTKVVNQVVLVGTKPLPAGGAGDIPPSGGLNWAALAQCESGGNPRAVNPAGPYYGLYQFDIGTWQSNGGSGIPSDASAAEQTRVAQNLYNARGRSPWPVCGKYL